MGAGGRGRGGPFGMKPKLPVTILTGYLGAGKTTLLNYMLKEQTDRKLAVIENEIGEVSVDGELVEQSHQDLAEEIVVLDNGCICCNIRGDLVNTLQKIGERYQQGQELDGVLIELTGVADPAPVVQTFFLFPEVQRAFFVDNVVALVDAKHAIKKLDESENDPDGKGTAAAQIAFSSTVLLNKVDLATEEELATIEKRIKAVNSTVDIIRCEQARAPMDKLFQVGAFMLDKVLEEQYMDEEEFNSFYKPKMDTSVSNVGVKCDGMISMFAFQQFMDYLLDTEEKAMDLLRIKGVINIAGAEQKFVLQCVHMLRKQSFTQPWGPDEKRENRIIFIGRGMQARRQELTDCFKACLVEPLRFPIGTKIMAKTGPDDDDYEPGKIKAHWDEYNAYRIVLLNSGDEVHAAIDSDAFVKAL